MKMLWITYFLFIPLSKQLENCTTLESHEECYENVKQFKKIIRVAKTQVSSVQIYTASILTEYSIGNANEVTSEVKMKNNIQIDPYTFFMWKST